MKNSLPLLVMFLGVFGFTYAQETHTLKLSSCRAFIFPAGHFDKDGLYREMHNDDSTLVGYEYQVVDGERQGPVKIFNAEGRLVAEGLFEEDRLKDGQLWVYQEGQKIAIQLDYDCPGWIFHDNWIRKSGPTEWQDGRSFLWLAGQRYRLPTEVKSLNL